MTLVFGLAALGFLVIAIIFGAGLVSFGEDKED